MVNPFSTLTRRWSKPRRAGYVRVDSDAPLNYHPDQDKNIRRQLTEVEVRRGVEYLRLATSIVIAGTSVALFLTKRYRLGTLFAVTFLAERALWRQGETEKTDVERYALKAERGDYGHLEVIPFR